MVGTERIAGMAKRQREAQCKSVGRYIRKGAGIFNAGAARLAPQGRGVTRKRSSPEVIPGGHSRRSFPEVIPGCHSRMSFPDVIPGCHSRRSFPEVIPGGHSRMSFPEVIPGGFPRRFSPEVFPGGFSRGFFSEVSPEASPEGFPRRPPTYSKAVCHGAARSGIAGGMSGEGWQGNDFAGQAKVIQRGGDRAVRRHGEAAERSKTQKARVDIRKGAGIFNAGAARLAP